MCEWRDVSVPAVVHAVFYDANFLNLFVLIAGTAITLMLLIGSSVSLPYRLSNQELPSGDVAERAMRDIDMFPNYYYVQ